jgi:hypothetical protein
MSRCAIGGLRACAKSEKKKEKKKKKGKDGLT